MILFYFTAICLNDGNIILLACFFFFSPMCATLPVVAPVVYCCSRNIVNWSSVKEARVHVHILTKCVITDVPYYHMQIFRVQI